MPKRLDPEILLRRADAESRFKTRGKLKIYLGAAPGVGKTYEMLEDSMEARRKGLDIVIGIVESHGRKEIENFCEHFEKVPRQKINYHGKELEEFDLDAALARNPGLILIDEMAHSNIPGLRHNKRWQDIKELLDNGINVYTTLNVQHIESLNDAISQIVNAPIHETVPDSMLESADTIELVDLPPEELLKRLDEGKVYVPEQAKLAKEHFFKKGNLIALRELALRTTAEQVGSQVFLYRQGEGIQSIWPTNEKILVCVGPGIQSVKLIRAAKRLAHSLKVKWMAVYVDTPKLNTSENKRNSAILNLKLAAQLGADTHVLTGFDIVKTIMAYAHEQNITQIMIWKNIRTRLRDLFFRNFADEVVRYSGEIDVYIMTGIASEEKYKEPPPIKKHEPWNAYFLTFGVVTLATIINLLIYPFLSNSNLIMIYLVGVIVIALLGRVATSILGSILSVLTYDFFFITPFYSFNVSSTQYFFTLIVMLLVSLIISHLVLLTKRHAELSIHVEHQTGALHKLSRQLASTRGVDNLLNVSVHCLADMFNCEVLILLPENSHLKPLASSCKIKKIDMKDESVAQWVYKHGQVAGLGTNTLASSDALYVPLLASKKIMGALRISPTENKRLFSPEEMNLLDECAIQIALALEVDQHSNSMQ